MRSAHEWGAFDFWQRAKRYKSSNPMRARVRCNCVTHGFNAINHIKWRWFTPPHIKTISLYYKRITFQTDYFHRNSSVALWCGAQSYWRCWCFFLFILNWYYFTVNECNRARYRATDRLSRSRDLVDVVRWTSVAKHIYIGKRRLWTKPNGKNTTSIPWKKCFKFKDHTLTNLFFKVSREQNVLRQH